MKKISHNSLLLIMGLLIPSVISAEVLTGIRPVIMNMHYIVRMLVPVMIGLAFVGFAWGIVKYLFDSDKTEAKKVMLWGIIAMFVITSVWGIVSVFRVTLLGEYEADNQVSIPSVLPQ